MAYKEYSTADLVTYSGRPEQSYTAYASQALLQALLLFKIGTCLASPDDLDATHTELLNTAILAMADAIFLNQEHQAAVASPFNSETIGSYSYSKTAKAVSAGQPTGIMWFDLAVTELSVCDRDDGIMMFGGIEMHDAVLVAGSAGANVRYLSPREIDYSRSFGFDPAMAI